jgi:parallel beta-helix repeat protein
MMKLGFWGSLVVVATLGAQTAPASAQTDVNCAKGQTITAALASGATDIIVIGTCKESPSITRSGVTLEGNPAVSTGGAVVGDIFIGGAQNVTIKKLTVSGAAYGIEVGFGSAAFITNTTVQNTTQEAISIYQGGSALLDHVTVQTNFAGVTVYTKSEVKIVDQSLIQNNKGVGIDVELGSSANIQNSTIKNNLDSFGPSTPGGGGINLFDGGHAFILNNVISGNTLSGVLVLAGSSALLKGNTITAIRSTDSAVDIERGASTEIRGGNTISNTASGGFALFVGYGATMVQQFGHDLIRGKVDISTGAVAAFFDVDTRGAVTIEERSTVDLSNTSANAQNISITGNTTLSEGSALHFDKPPNAHLINIAGNVTCSDTESRVARLANVNVAGTVKCQPY